MSRICPMCHKLIYASNISTQVGIDNYCSCATEIKYETQKDKKMINEPSVHFVTVDLDGQFFTDLAQIYNCLTIKENSEKYKELAIKALDNTIKKGYIMVHKDNQLYEGTPFNPSKPKVVPYQLCPKCNGTGKVLNNENWGRGTSFSSTSLICDLCNGAKVIPQAVIE